MQARDTSAADAAAVREQLGATAERARAAEERAQSLERAARAE
ncbi:hypothetical protein ABZ914_08285 [Spirillospora sp. NPDC046719]